MKRVWMPLYIADFLADTSHLNSCETGAYLLLIMHYWNNSGLPKDDARLARIARVSAVEWAEIRAVIYDFFDENWRHKRIEKELCAMVLANQRRVSAGSKGGRAKAQAVENKRKYSNATSMLGARLAGVVALDAGSLASNAQVVENKQEFSNARAMSSASVIPFPASALVVDQAVENKREFSNATEGVGVGGGGRIEAQCGSKTAQVIENADASSNALAPHTSHYSITILPTHLDNKIRDSYKDFGNSKNSKLQTVRAKPRCRILGTAEPSEQDSAFSKSNNCNISIEWPKFLDHHVARGSVMADWAAAWRTWVRNSRRFSGSAAAAPKNGFFEYLSELEAGNAKNVTINDTEFWHA